MNLDMLNLSNVLVSELRANSPYRTGNMRNSIATVVVDEKYVDIIIATDYASFVNQKGIHKGWIEDVVKRVCEAYADKNDNESLANLTGFITYGG